MARERVTRVFRLSYLKMYVQIHRVGAYARRCVATRCPRQSILAATAEYQASERTKLLCKVHLQASARTGLYRFLFPTRGGSQS